MIKHIGKHATLGHNLVVVFRQVPNEENNCLVIESDSLPSMIQDSLKAAVESREAQDASNLGDALVRKNFPTGDNMLGWLHSNGFMKKLPTDQVLLTPRSGHTSKLDEVNKIIAQENQPKEQSTPVAEPVLDIPPMPSQTVNNNVQAAMPARSNDEMASELFARSEQLKKLAEECYDMSVKLNPQLKRPRGRPRST